MCIRDRTKKSKGQIIVPTGGGKTMCMIHDTLREYDKGWSTIVIVAPRILLANQLSTEFLEVIHDHYKHTNVLHVHSGETHHFSTTKPSEIAKWDRVRGRKIIFTTYHSLHRIQESGIYVDTIYFDEAHNAVQRNFIDSVRYFSKYALRSYFFTATPKHSLSPTRVGMNHSNVFGNVICQVPAPKLVQEGYILPPKVEIYKSRILHKDELVAERDCEQMIDAIDNLTKDKVLICESPEDLNIVIAGGDEDNASHSVFFSGFCLSKCCSEMSHSRLGSWTYIVSEPS